MADPKNILPGMVNQNPAPFAKDSQDRKAMIRSQADLIIAEMTSLLPSNYVSQVPGPFYTMEFQAIAERLAEFQITAQEVMADTSYDFTRSEVLFQIIGSLVFPDANTFDGWPVITGDVTYRDFLQRMVELLLKGATKDSVTGGVEALTDASVTVIEKAIAARQTKGSLWGTSDQFTFEINVSGKRRVTVDDEEHSFDQYLIEIDNVNIDLDSVRVFSQDKTVEYERDVDYRVLDNGVIEIQKDRIPIGAILLLNYDYFISDFPNDPLTLQKNINLVMKALKPAHTLYEYRHVFHETFKNIITSEVINEWGTSTYHYDDFRKNWTGTYAISGSTGETLTDRSLFRDVNRDFSSIRPGSYLTITEGVNKDEWLIEDVKIFPFGDDPVPRRYTTLPTGLSGFLTVNGPDVIDIDGDFVSVIEGEILTIHEGLNAGQYRINALCGLNGGVIRTGHPAPLNGMPYNRVRISPSLLKIKNWMPESLSDQVYSVTVDRLGMQRVHIETDVDVTNQFF